MKLDLYTHMIMTISDYTRYGEIFSTVDIANALADKGINASYNQVKFLCECYVIYQGKNISSHVSYRPYYTKLKNAEAVVFHPYGFLKDAMTRIEPEIKLPLGEKFGNFTLPHEMSSARIAVVNLLASGKQFSFLDGREYITSIIEKRIISSEDFNTITKYIYDFMSNRKYLVFDYEIIELKDFLNSTESPILLLLPKIDGREISIISYLESLSESNIMKVNPALLEELHPEIYRKYMDNIEKNKSLQKQISDFKQSLDKLAYSFTKERVDIRPLGAFTTNGRGEVTDNFGGTWNLNTGWSQNVTATFSVPVEMSQDAAF